MDLKIMQKSDYTINVNRAVDRALSDSLAHFTIDKSNITIDAIIVITDFICIYANMARRCKVGCKQRKASKHFVSLLKIYVYINFARSMR